MKDELGLGGEERDGREGKRMRRKGRRREEETHLCQLIKRSNFGKRQVIPYI